MAGLRIRPCRVKHTRIINNYLLAVTGLRTLQLKKARCCEGIWNNKVLKNRLHSPDKRMGIIMKLKNQIIGLSFLLTLSPTYIFSQKIHTLSVLDANTHQFIPGVNIFSKRLKTGTVSDQTGKFSFPFKGLAVTDTVIFQHIAFDKLEVPAWEVMTGKNIFLQPRVIPLKGVEIQAETSYRPEYLKDMPQKVAQIEAKEFEIRGFVDAGDLLRVDQSAQVKEELSGKKTIALRGGNPDEVTVLYNGVKMNNTFNNIFDLSLIDLEDIKRFEIIKGSNTALYGSDAFSGVINIVPKTKLNYRLRFQQRVGTYRSGNWGLHINPGDLIWDSPKILTSYSYKRGALARQFADEDTGENFDEERSQLNNESEHHTASLGYAFLDGNENRSGSRIDLIYLNTRLSYNNQRDNENLENKNELFTLKFQSDRSAMHQYSASIAQKKLLEDQAVNSENGILDRNYNDKSFHANLENVFTFGEIEWLTGYQYEQTTFSYLIDRNITNQSAGTLLSADVERVHHGFVSIGKIHHLLQSPILKTFDINMSVRHDKVRDNQKDKADGGLNTGQQGIFGSNDWKSTLVKFSFGLEGGTDDLDFNTYLNFGRNTKFPTLFQQTSTAAEPPSINRQGIAAILGPEHNNSVELGVDLKRQLPFHPSLFGWGMSANYFNNHYDNKIVTFASPLGAVASYFTVPDATISGLEFSGQLFLYKKQVTLSFGLSKYNISDQQAFPFKSDLKRTIGLLVNHKGYSFQAHFFTEGEQIGVVRNTLGKAIAVNLEDHTNIDLHLSKTYDFHGLKFFLNMSGRNLLNTTDVVLQGIAIRDRRYYITLGTQF